MKKCLRLEIDTVTKFLLFRMKYIVTDGGFIWLLPKIMTSLSQCINEVIHLFITWLLSISLYQLNYYFLMSSKAFKEYWEY